MSQKRLNNQFRSRWPEWLLPAFFLPSWLMSLGFHMIVFVGVALLFQNTGVTEGLDKSGRVIDIFVKEAANSDDQSEEFDASLSDKHVSKIPPEDLVDEFLVIPPVIENYFGLGPANADVELPLAEPIRPRRSTPTADSLPTNRGETQFFGIKDKGTRFVFVIDCSDSMQSHNAIHFAKSELKKAFHCSSRHSNSKSSITTPRLIPGTAVDVMRISIGQMRRTNGWPITSSTKAVPPAARIIFPH